MRHERSLWLVVGTPILAKEFGPCDNSKRSPSSNIIPSEVMIRIMGPPVLRAHPLSDMQRLHVVLPALAI